MERLGYILTALADIALPRECPVCGRILGMKESQLCIYCAADFPFTYNWLETHNAMADKLNEILNRHLGEELDKGEENRYETYSYAAALFFYNSEAGFKHIPQQLKYHHNTRLGKHFSRMLGERLFSAPHFKDADLIVPVPLHWKRKMERGYNQAETIASTLARTGGIACAPDLLVRKRRTATQTRLDIESKRLNVADAFRINRRIAERHAPHHIILTDDVFTTGATTASCHRVLRSFYGKEARISVATLAAVSNG